MCGHTRIGYVCLDGAFLAHCQLRRLRVCLWNQSLDAKVYLEPRAFVRGNVAIPPAISAVYRLWTGANHCKQPVTGAKKINHAKIGRRVHEATASPQLGRRYQTPR